MAQFVFTPSEIEAVKNLYYAYCVAAKIERNFDEEIAKEDSHIFRFDGENMVVDIDPRIFVMMSEHAVEHMSFYYAVGIRFMGIANAFRDFIKFILPESKEFFVKLKVLVKSLEQVDIERRLELCSIMELGEKLASYQESLDFYRTCDGMDPQERQDSVDFYVRKYEMVKRVIEAKEPKNPQSEGVPAGWTEVIA